ncbi:MAG: tetratricopeptide repeat protein [Hormoscilla sp.]
MKSILGSLIVASICFAPGNIMLMYSPSWGVTANIQEREILRRQQQAWQQTQQGKYTEAIGTWQQVLSESKKQGRRDLEANAMLGLGVNYNNIGRTDEALYYYNEAAYLNYYILGDESGSATALNNMGLVYKKLGEEGRALEFYNLALRRYEEGGDRAGIAIVLQNIGGLYRGQGSRKKALDYYNRVRKIIAELGDGAEYEVRVALKVKILKQIAGLEKELGQGEKALESYQELLLMSRELADSSTEAATLNAMGTIYYEEGKWQEALAYYQQGLSIERDRGSSRELGTTLNNIGAVYKQQGEATRALEFYDRALQISREVGDRISEAIALSNIGAVYLDREDSQQALKNYSSAWSILKEVGDRSSKAATLTGLGAAYRNLGQDRQALNYYQQALPLRQQMGDRPGEVEVLYNIGVAYRAIGQRYKALQSFSGALPIIRQLRDREREVATLNHMAAAYGDLELPERALQSYQQALPIAQKLADRSVVATTLNNIAAVYGDLGEAERALSFFQQALVVDKEVGVRSPIVKTLKNIAILYQVLDRPAEAIGPLEEAVKISIQMQQAGMLKSREYRQLLIPLLDLLIEQKQVSRAYEWVNLATIVDLADYFRRIEGRVANPEAEAAMARWQGKHEEINLLEQQLAQNYDVGVAQELQNSQASLSQQEAAFASQFPEVAELLYRTPIESEQLLSKIPGERAIVHPVLLTGVENVSPSLAIFVLTKEGINVRKEKIKPEELDRLLQDYRQQISDPKDRKYRETSVKLYEILIGPVAGEIQAAAPQQLSIIARGNLGKIPWEILCESESESRKECDRASGDEYLIEKYVVNYLTRVEGLTGERTEALNLVDIRAIALQILISLVVVIIVGSVAIWLWRKPGIILSGALLLLWGSGALWLLMHQNVYLLAVANPSPAPVNLPEVTAREISRIFPNSKAYIGSQATLDRFKSQGPRYLFLHLETHGCFQPGGCANLGMEENTLLFANNQTFPIGNVALLGLEKTELISMVIPPGPEISGLAYLWKMAGAKGTIGNLWSSEDGQQGKIAIAFYQNIKQGMSPPQALQQAKLSAIDRHPAYWSSLILIGGN